MAITSSDIDNQSFSVERRGYNTEEVDLFLEHVSKEVDNFNNTITRLEKKERDQSGELYAVSKKEKDELLAKISEKDEKINALKHEIDTKTADSKAISQALVVAQSTADKIVADANEKAEKIVQEANNRSDQIAKKAEDQKKMVMDEIAKLEKCHSSAKKKYESMLREIIDIMNKNLGDAQKMKLPGDSKSDVTGAIKKASHVGSNKSPLITNVNKPIQGTGSIPNNNHIESKPAKDFSGYGDAVFGDEKID